MNWGLRGDGSIEDVDGDCPPQYGRVVGDDDDDDFHLQEGTSLPEGEIIIIIITNNSPILGRAISINIFTSTISSQNPSSSLVFNLCTGTSDWYLWVTSSVDYIL